MKAFRRTGKRFVGVMVAGALCVSAVLNGVFGDVHANKEEKKEEKTVFNSYCLEGYGTGQEFDATSWTINTIYENGITEKYMADDFKAGIFSNPHSKDKESVIRLINGVELEDMAIVGSENDHRAGNAIMNKTVKLGMSGEFSAKFTVSMPEATCHDGYKRGAGGDGIVFIITSNEDLNGLSGGAIGYMGIDNSLGIELDSFYNTGNGTKYYDPEVTTDYRKDHVAVVVGGVNTTPLSHIGTSFLFENGYTEGFTGIGELAVTGEEVDTRLFTVWVEYDGEDLYVCYAKGDFNTAVRPNTAQIFVDGSENPAVKNQLVDFANQEVKIGFTSGIGSSKANHTVHSVAFLNEYIEGGIQSTYIEKYYVETPEATEDFIEVEGKKYVLAGSNLVVEVAAGTEVAVTDLSADFGKNYEVVDYTEVGYPNTAKVAADGSTVVNQFFAIQHEHEFEYDAEGNKITAECEDDDCEINDKEISIEINAEDEYYTGNPYSSAELEDKLTGITGDEEPVIYYEGTLADGTVYEKTTTPPTEVGEYKATVTVGGVTAEDAFNIVELKITADDEYYSGNEYDSDTVEMPLDTDDELVVYYEGIGDTEYDKSTTPPTEVGTYKATAVLGDATATDEFAIVELKINAEDEYYTGNPYSSAELVDKITGATGDEELVIYYEGTLADGTPYEKTTVPPTEIGTYTATVTVGGITVKDDFKIAELKITANDEYYSGNPYSSDAVETSKDEDKEDVVVYYEGIGDTEYEKSTTPPTEVGTYKATAVLGEATATDEFAIVELKITAEDEYYTGNEYSSDEVEAPLGSEEDVVVYYEGIGDTEYEKSTTPPTEVGTYKATAVLGDITSADEFKIVDIKITAEDEYYTGNEYSSDEVEIPLETDDELVVYYEGIGETEYEKSTTPPTEVGTYKATAVYGEATAEDDFEIKPHKHFWWYQGEGNEITGECIDMQGKCEADTTDKKVEINAEDMYYTGDVYDKATVENDLSEVTGDYPSDIYYEGVGDTVYEKSTIPPTEVGTYKATVSLDGAIAEDEFEIKPHKHFWWYEGEGNVITGECIDMQGKCEADTTDKKIEINAEDMYYTGDTYDKAVVENDLSEVTGDYPSDIYYVGTGDTDYPETTTPPTEVGTYQVIVKMDNGAKAYDDFEILHVHEFEYDAEDNKITAECEDDDCELNDEEISIEINADDEYYTGNPYSSAEIVDELTSITGDEVPEIYYEGVGDTEYEKSTTPPTEIGTYKATVTVGGVTAEDDFVIADLVINADDEYYSGNPYSSAEVGTSIVTDEEPVVYYEGIGETVYEKTTVPPTEVGTYKATVELAGATAEDDFEIIHVHEFDYEAEDNKITADCDENGCDLDDEEISIEINAEDVYYTGNPYDRAEIIDELTSITGDEVPEIYYEGVGNTEYDKTTVPPTEVGDYKATVTVGGVTAEDDFSIVELKIVAENENYTGNPYSSDEVFAPLETDEQLVVYYEGIGDTEYEKTTVPPTEVGTYVAIAVLGEATAEDDFKIIPVIKIEDAIDFDDVDDEEIDDIIEDLVEDVEEEEIFIDIPEAGVVQTGDMVNLLAIFVLMGVCIASVMASNKKKEVAEN